MKVKYCKIKIEIKGKYVYLLNVLANAIKSVRQMQKKMIAYYLGIENKISLDQIRRKNLKWMVCCNIFSLPILKIIIPEHNLLTVYIWFELLSAESLVFPQFLDFLN